MAAATFATGRATVVALAIGVLGLALGLAVGLTQGVLPGSILMGFVFWVGLSLGGLALLLIGHMAGGSWAAVIRRPLEAMVSALPVALLFFIPIVLLIPQLYPWADAAYVEAHELVAWKAGYLNTTWYVLRAVLYFGVWVLTAWVYLRGAREQDRVGVGPAGRIGYRLKNQAAAWLVVYVLTITLATTDWTMSLTPEWWSGIYGVVFMIGQAIAAMALVILTVVWTADRSARMDELLTEKRLQDLGNFLMAFTMFWAYVNASQLIIQWSNNVVETNTFFNLRLNQEPWAGMGIYLLVAGFALPFLVLFSRWVKRKRGALAFMAGWAILTQIVHVYWYVAPAVGRAGLPGVADLAILVGLGGVWSAAYFRSLGSRSVVPEHDPRLLAAEHVAHGAHHDAGAATPEVRHAG
ncbi:MAG: hypothetical protein P1P87_09520 [Trueperaceae bacterium]|nr:hypothetical protein [Trueperaceae bacterium]